MMKDLAVNSTKHNGPRVDETCNEQQRKNPIAF